MKLFIMTKCVSDKGKCIPSCEVFSSEEEVRVAIEKDEWESIRACADKYEISTGNIEPKNNQGARTFRIYGEIYTWKIKSVEISLEPDSKVFILLHAHNRGDVFYAEAHVFDSREGAAAAMKSQLDSSLEMWRLMCGKTLYGKVGKTIGEDRAKIELNDEVEAWVVEEKVVPSQA